MALLLLSLLLWWKLLDKTRLSEAFLYALIALILILGIEEYGEELALWTYPVDIIPVFPPLTSGNLLLLPLLYSLLFQRFCTTKRFASASLVATAGVCFILDPLLVRFGLYELIRWRYYLNFPLYFTAAVISRAVIMKITRIGNTKAAKAVTR